MYFLKQSSDRTSNSSSFEELDNNAVANSLSLISLILSVNANIKSNLDKVDSAISNCSLNDLSSLNLEYLGFATAKILVRAVIVCTNPAFADETLNFSIGSFKLF